MSATKKEAASVAPEVLSEFQKIDARLRSSAAAVAQAERQRAIAEEVIDRESFLNAKYAKDLAAFVKRVGGIPTPPKEGTTGDWTLEPVKE